MLAAETLPANQRSSPESGVWLFWQRSCTECVFDIHHVGVWKLKWF